MKVYSFKHVSMIALKRTLLVVILLNLFLYIQSTLLEFDLIKKDALQKIANDNNQIREKTSYYISKISYSNEFLKDNYFASIIHEKDSM